MELWYFSANLDGYNIRCSMAYMHSASHNGCRGSCHGFMEKVPEKEMCFWGPFGAGFGQQAFLDTAESHVIGIIICYCTMTNRLFCRRSSQHMSDKLLSPTIVTDTSIQEYHTSHNWSWRYLVQRQLTFRRAKKCTMPLPPGIISICDRTTPTSAKTTHTKVEISYHNY